MANRLDHAWYRALKSALRELSPSERKAIKLVWDHPGVPVYLLPEMAGKKRGGMVWLAIGDRIAKRRLWKKMPRRIRSQNERPGYSPFYSGVIVKLSTVVDRARNRWVCFDFHVEAIRALRELRLISNSASNRARAYAPLDELDNDKIIIQQNLPAETKRSLRSIVVRRGQNEFRRTLLQAYGGRCAVTGCTEVDVLEAAHIKSFSRRGKYDATNGLLLRSDWHALYDLNLWSIDPRTTKIVISNRLADSAYTQFSGRRMRLPDDPKLGPSSEALRERHFAFMTAASKRSGKPMGT